MCRITIDAKRKFSEILAHRMLTLFEDIEMIEREGRVQIIFKACIYSLLIMYNDGLYTRWRPSQ